MKLRSDVCLLLEGTYPYISGGVSAWVHQLISALKEIKFSLMVILPNQDYIREMKYDVPSNVIDIRRVFIHDYDFPDQCVYSNPRKKKLFNELENFIGQIIQNNPEGFETVCQCFDKTNSNYLTHEDMLFSKQSWDMLRNLYKKNKLGISFIDFFWTYRFTALPMLPLFTADIPPATIYHTISTGYAGILGSIAKIKSNAVLLLTEHGIYSKERRMEISQASWIYDENKNDNRPQKNRSFFKQWWITLFDSLSRICYDHSQEIITLYTGNQQQQILAGAPMDKLSIIPNGIDMNKYKAKPRKIKPGQKSFNIGFVGRVVPIKDVKTFIKACKTVLGKMPESKIFIIGPTDEEEEYYEDCLRLCEMLGVKDNIVFTGIASVLDYYPKLDIIVLTSESEAQPLVLLEANAMGIPVVSSDVGACSEMVNGMSAEDKSLGASGLITGVASPSETADAILKILSDPNLFNLMSQAGITRVDKFYNQADLFAKYLNLYEKYMY